MKGAYFEGECQLGTCKGSEAGKWKVYLWVSPPQPDLHVSPASSFPRTRIGDSRS